MEVHQEADLQCVIHADSQASSSVIIPFTQSTYRKCQHVLAARKKLKMQYSYIKLPKDISVNTGYHSSCYRRFTAVKKATLQAIPEEEICSLLYSEETEQNDVKSDDKPTENMKIVTRQRSAPILKDKTTLIFRKVCIFCDKRFVYFKRRKVPLTACETKKFENRIKNIAELSNDYKLLKKIVDVDFVAKEVMYHRICYVRYENNMKKQQKLHEKPSDWSTKRQLHNTCFQLICSWISENIVKNEEVQFLGDVYGIFMQFVFEADREYYEFKKRTYKSYHLLNGLRAFFGKTVHFSKYGRKIIIHSKKINRVNAIQLIVCKISDLETNHNIEKVALKLRRDILSLTRKPLPINSELNDVFAGECEVPASVSSFFSTLLTGPNSRRQKYPNVRIDSLSQDAVYAVTNGNVKPNKHLELGLALKSLTGSRKVLNILNRLGHCASYSIIEELETELTYSAISNDGRIVPKDFHKLPNLSSSLAFDNFDRYVETTSGKDTLHDTVGILYQHCTNDKNETTAQIEAPTSESDTKPKSQKRRRVFDAFDDVIEPYYKKPKYNKILCIDISDMEKPPTNIDLVTKMDNMWVFSLSLLKEDVPMWTGWNSERIVDNLPKQKIWYLPPINYSPTSTSVVLHTLKLAQSVAEECQEKYISVTYDLAIAKIALQIQCEEAPKYDTILIQLGAFHIQMSLLKAIGKFLEESGGPYILMESNVMAAGSLKGFLSGTHFNRGKRVHMLLAAAIQSLHVQSFLANSECDVNKLKSELRDMENANTSNCDNVSPDTNSLLANYDSYYVDTLNGKHGKTAKYWIIYVDLVRLFQTFSRSIRTGDFELYVYCLPKIASIMFAMNHQNYSRWLLKFYESLSNIDQTHPGLKKNIMNGGFSIRRTDKNFSRSPIDLTLEQTINADAASRLGGISSFTNSISARRRWAVSHSIRTSLITHLLNKLDLSLSENVSNETRPHVIKKNSAAVSTIIQTIEDTLNPFDRNLNGDKLFNLGSGKAASALTANFLLNVLQIGRNARNSFVTECQEDSQRFERSIKKINVSTFASESKSEKTRKAGKLHEITFERDLMGRMLLLAIENQIDLEVILQYPLTPIPLALGHLDRAIHKTSKSVFFKYLEKKVVHGEPSYVDCTIADGFYFLHLTSINLPSTFGRMAFQILLKACQLKGDRVDLVFDKAVSPSVKDIERDKRANLFERDAEYHITGADQKRPTDFLKALRSDRFKSSLIKFFVNEWAKDHYSSVLGNKLLHVTCDDKCYKFYNINGHIVREEVEHLSSTHEEADSKIMYHLSQMPENSNVIVKASDTDILIIVLGSIHLLPQNVSVWMETGLQSANTLRLVNINALAASLGSSLNQSLPAFHAITGCDYTAAFFKKGKITPFKILEQNKRLQQIFSTLGQSENLTDEQISAVEQFTCMVYGKRKHSEVNKARYEAFLEAYQPKKQKDPFHNIKKLDGSSLPPCKTVLVQKIRRVNQICAIWKHACEKKPFFYEPAKHGWLLKDDKYVIDWFSGPQYPDNFEGIIVTEPSDDEDNDNCCYDTSDEDE